MVHYLVTRFNLRTNDWKFAKDGSKVLTKTWMKDRWHLFETYCVPSVKNQTNTNFTWLVFFDTNTDNFYKEKIKDLSISFPNFQAVFIDSMNVFQKSIQSAILNAIPNAQQQIITTRLDNDDIIHRCFIEKIQELAINVPHGTVVDLRKGYQMELDKKTTFRKINLSFNPFISVVEDADKLQTIISKTHEQWQKATNVKSDTDNYLWIQVIHQSNKLNTSLNHFYYSIKNPSGFGLNPNLDVPNKITLRLKNVGIYLRNSLKAFVNLAKKRF